RGRAEAAARLRLAADADRVVEDGAGEVGRGLTRGLPALEDVEGYAGGVGDLVARDLVGHGAEARDGQDARPTQLIRERVLVDHRVGAHDRVHRADRRGVVVVDDARDIAQTEVERVVRERDVHRRD